MMRDGKRSLKLPAKSTPIPRGSGPALSVAVEPTEKSKTLGGGVLLYFAMFRSCSLAGRLGGLRVLLPPVLNRQE